MYILKLDYVNGLHKEYAFDALGAASAAFEEAHTARKKGGTIEFLQDEAGRKASVDGGKLQSVELVDLQAEALSAIKFAQEVQFVHDKFGAGAQRPRVRDNGPVAQERDEEPEYRPAIGSRAQFSS